MSSSPPITGTGLAVVTDRKWSLHLFYQLLNGEVGVSRHLDGVWTKDNLTVKPVDDSPLAAVTYDGGKQIRIYYVDTEYTLQEYAYTAGKGWYQGEINKLNIKVVPSAGLAAVAYGSVHLRVYYQELGSNVIAEAANDGYWHAGELRLSGGLGGTQLAAVAYYFQGQDQIRLYYQATDLTIKEHGHNNSGWFSGAFHEIQATARTAIAAIAFATVELQVYWRDRDGHLVYSKNTGAWGPPTIIEAAGPGYEHAVLQWDDGKYIRLYYQEYAGAIVELYSDDGGSSWRPGELRVQ